MCNIYITLMKINSEREEQFKVFAWLFKGVFLKKECKRGKDDQYLKNVI